MARLCRVHFVGLGESCARFHPLTLDLRHPKTGAAQESVIWLRNGGGKTTLISLLYSVLIPNQNYFLGRLLGKPTSLADFLRPNELAAMVTEWEFPTLGTPKRIVGQLVQLKDRDLKRRFFSFYTIPEFGFEHIGLLGLGTPARSMDAVLDQLREAERRHGGRMDVVIPGDDQTQWEKHLEERGLDPFLFRLHLRMNKQEGGASDLFKIKSPEDFIRLFLELVFDERTTEELEKSLVLLREKIARSPDREIAVEFGNALLTPLRHFVAEAAQRKHIREEQSQVWRELAALDMAISNLLKELDKQEGSLEKEKSEVDELLNSHDKERVQYTRFRGGYERLCLELRVQETAHALQQAQEAEREVTRRQNLLNAAIAWAALLYKNRELEACVKQLDGLRQDHRPEYESIRRSGAILAATWDAKINALTKNQEEAKADVRNAKKELTRIQGERLQLTKRQGGAEADRDLAKTALNRVDDARRLLRQEDLIESNESGRQAQTRWELLAEETKRELSELQRQANELKRDYDDAVQEQMERGKSLRERQNECADVQRKLETATNLEKEVATLPAIVGLCEGTAANLRNPHLLTQLDARADAAETRLIELGIANEEDRRSLHYLDHQGLLAPSVDITNLIRRLHDAGVRSALPLYRWLAEHRDISEAVQLLHANPALFAGILVQNGPELEIARREIDSFNLKMPVMLVTPESLQRPLAGASTEEHVIIPSEQGLFSLKEAALARPRLEERGQTRQGEHDEAARVRKESAEAAAGIRSYLKEWPESRISELKTAAASYTEEIQAITSLIGTEADRIARIKNQQEANGGTQVTCASRLGKAQGNAKQLKTFVIEHENQVEKWKSQHEASLKEIENIAEQFRSLEHDEPFYNDLEDSAGNRIIKLQEDITLARTSRDKISPEYIGDAPAEQPTTLPEELEPAFYASVASYEGKVQKGVIDGKIEVLKAAAEELQRAFERVGTDLPQPEVEVAAQRPALQAELAEQNEAVVSARAQLTNAKEKHATAMAQRPDPREFKKGTDTNDALFDRPATSQLCEAIVVAISKKLELLGKVLKEGNDNLSTIQSGLSRIAARRPLYKSLHGRVKREQCSEISPHSKFSEDDSSNQTLVDEICRQFAELEQSLGKVEGLMRKRFDKEIHPLITDERFAKRNITFRQRLQRLTFEDYATEGDSHVRAVEDQVRVCQAELDSQEQEKRILVQKLDTLARQAVNLLEQAARVSELPETMGVWARQPFLRINIPKKNDPNERQVLIGQAVDRWFLAGQNIPQGYALAYECLIALCGAKTINVRILKPEYQLRAVSHDIMDLVTKFSDGEKLTAAIVLYCILVRLRSRLKARAEHLLEGDAGLLLLDNPFGKATLATFVDLQLKMARMMGVQLVYATGINDFSALKHFPHYVRLRNSSRGKATNDYHVTADSRPLEESITAVTLGFKQNGNGQPK